MSDNFDQLRTKPKAQHTSLEDTLQKKYEGFFNSEKKQREKLGKSIMQEIAGEKAEIVAKDSVDVFTRSVRGSILKKNGTLKKGNQVILEGKYVLEPVDGKNHGFLKIAINKWTPQEQVAYISASQLKIPEWNKTPSLQHISEEAAKKLWASRASRTILEHEIIFDRNSADSRTADMVHIKIATIGKILWYSDQENIIFGTHGIGYILGDYVVYSNNTLFGEETRNSFQLIGKDEKSITFSLKKDGIYKKYICKIWHNGLLEGPQEIAIGASSDVKKTEFKKDAWKDDSGNKKIYRQGEKIAYEKDVDTMAVVDLGIGQLNPISVDVFWSNPDQVRVIGKNWVAVYDTSNKKILWKTRAENIWDIVSFELDWRITWTDWSAIASPSDGKLLWKKNDTQLGLDWATDFKISEDQKSATYKLNWEEKTIIFDLKK